MTPRKRINKFSSFRNLSANVRNTNGRKGYKEYNRRISKDKPRADTEAIKIESNNGQ